MQGDILNDIRPMTYPIMSHLFSFQDVTHVGYHTGQFPVNWNQGKLAQNVIFQWVPGVLRPVFPFRVEAGGVADSARPGAWLLSRAHGLRPAGCERDASKNVCIPVYHSSVSRV